MKSISRAAVSVVVPLLLGCEFEPGQGNVPPEKSENAANVLQHIERRNMADGPGGGSGATGGCGAQRVSTIRHDGYGKPFFLAADRVS